MFRRGSKGRKAKKVSYELIGRDTVAGAPTYTLLAEVVAADHQELIGAQLALAWCTSWKPDTDGRMNIGKCKRASDLDRELAAFDFVILLNRETWLIFSDEQRAALLDHELSHAALKHDEKGQPVEDERGRRVYRLRKHDVEEFAAVVERYGCYKRDLEQFAAALRRAPTRRQADPDCQLCEGSGWKRVTEGGDLGRMTRCDCWQASAPLPLAGPGSNPAA